MSFLDDYGPCEYWDHDGCYCVCGAACSCGKEAEQSESSDDLYRRMKQHNGPLPRTHWDRDE